MKALSIMQPWASLIVFGYKDIENRTWSTKVRGKVLVHASKKLDFEGYISLKNNWMKFGLPNELGDFLDYFDISKVARGGIVGSVDIVDCVEKHSSNWKIDDCFGFVLANPEPLSFTPIRGQLGFFEVTMPWEVDS